MLNVARFRCVQGEAVKRERTRFAKSREIY